MSLPGSSPLAAVRDGMWGFLLFAGVVWLAIGWSVLRLEPDDIVLVAGPVLLFGALMEAVRALAGTRTWWLNAGLAVLFAATGVTLLLAPSESSYTTPAALVGWFLMVRGAADVALSMVTRESDRIWGLLLVVGVTEACLGFFAASPLARTADLMILVVGALGLLRGVADLVAALRLREAPRVSLPALPPERVAGVAGYSAGLTDGEWPGARHRATARLSPGEAVGTPHASVGKPGKGYGAVSEPTTWPAAPGRGSDTSANTAAGGFHGPAGNTSAPGNATSGSNATSAADSFHDEVLRTTADLDMMLALAGVTGAAVGVPIHHDLPPVPDSPEGVESSPGGQGREHHDDHPGAARSRPGSAEDTTVIARSRAND